jgi:(S)-citramalyl-CoA lyase
MSDSSVQPRRSLIFAPGDRPELYPKAVATGADIVCVDLEDAVAPKNKARARADTIALFAAPRPDDGIERVVRINCLRSADGLRDVLAILESETPPPGLAMTKVKSADEVRHLADLLCEGPHAAIRLHIIVETNEALEAAHEIAHASPRIDSLLFGAVDLAAELCTVVDWETLLYARSRLVNAAAGAGLDLMDVPHLDLKDPDGLARDAARAAKLGFTGKAAIHPTQVAAINQAFSPDQASIEYAKRVIDAFAAAAGKLVVVDGKLIEPPVLRSMHRTLAIAERIGISAS